MQKITLNITWPFSSKDFRELLLFAFQVSLIAFLGFNFIENIREGFVDNYLNTNIFLWSAIVSGVLSILWPHVVVGAKNNDKPDWRSFLWIIILSLVCAAVVWLKISSLGWIAMVIASLSGLIIFCLCYFVYFDRND